jgi:hypothetical protein
MFVKRQSRNQKVGVARGSFAEYLRISFPIGTELEMWQRFNEFMIKMNRNDSEPRSDRAQIDSEIEIETEIEIALSDQTVDESDIFVGRTHLEIKSWNSTSTLWIVASLEFTFTFTFTYPNPNPCECECECEFECECARVKSGENQHENRVYDGE